MGARHGKGLAERDAGGGSSGARRGPLAAALSALISFLCLLGLAATASAAPVGAAPAPAAAPDSSAQARLARMALQQAMLTAAVPGPDAFGFSVAIDGDTALVGAPSRGNATGAAYVFVRSGGSWTQQQTLTAADGAPNMSFGAAVAVFANLALIGAPGDATTGQESIGAAYLFIRSDGVWTQRSKLTAADGAPGDLFGSSVALSRSTALVGAKLHDVAGKVWAGAAYVFVSGRPAWTQQAELNADDCAEYDKFGSAVAIDFDTVVVGAPAHSPAGNTYAGAAYVLVRTVGWTGVPAWTQQAELTAADGAQGDHLGASVAVSGDTALAGAPDKTVSGRAKAGAAYVFTRSADSWAPQTELTATDVAAAGKIKIGFGTSVALSGNAALVGAPGHDHETKTDPGAAYAFTRSGALWVQEQIMTADVTAAHEKLGTSVALSGDTALVGAPRHYFTELGDTGGAAYVFLTEPSIKSFKPAAGPVGTSVTITGSFFSGVTGVAFNGVATEGFIQFGIAITAEVPSGAQTGPITLTFPSGIVISDDSFIVVPAPAIAKLQPAFGKRGATVTITGSGFGALRGKSAVAFGGKACADYVSWSDTKIRCKVPVDAAYGSVHVTVKTRGGTSNAKSFKVRH